MAVPTQIPSEEPHSRAFDLRDVRNSLSEQPPALCPTSVPGRVIEILFNIYMTYVVHHYPIFEVSEVEQAFSAISNTQIQELGPRELDARSVYIVSLIMAVSLSTAARNNLKHAQSLATALFNNAMKYSSTVLSNNLPGLQALLLLIQYVTFNPHAGNLWLLTGISSEACIDLGLHQEVPVSAGLEQAERERRRRIFWCAWEMEIAVSAGFRRPIRTLNEYITVQFPSKSESYEPYGVTRAPGETTTATPVLLPIAMFIWRFRQLESETVSILHDNQCLPPGMSVDTWISRMEKDVHAWREEIRQLTTTNTLPCFQSQYDELLLWSEIGYPYLLVLLYGPSDRVKNPTRPSLMKAFRASVRVASGFWENSNTEFGHIKYTFHPCYQTWSAAIAFLQALQNCQAEISEWYSLQEVEDHAHCFSRLFSTIAERWGAVRRCLEEFNRLAVPIKQSFAEFLAQRNDSLLQLTMQDPCSSANQLAIDTIDYLNFTPILDPFSYGPEEAWVLPTTVMPDNWDVEFGFAMDNVNIAL